LRGSISLSSIKIVCTYNECVPTEEDEEDYDNSKQEQGAEDAQHNHCRQVRPWVSTLLLAYCTEDVSKGTMKVFFLACLQEEGDTYPAQQR
jgi:hypothetical protein